MSREVPILQTPEQSILTKLSQLRTHIVDRADLSQNYRDKLGQLLNTAYKEIERLRGTYAREREIPCLNESMREMSRMVYEMEAMYAHYNNVMQHTDLSEYQSPLETLLAGLVKEAQKNCQEKDEEIDVPSVTYTLLMELQTIGQQLQRAEVHETRITTILQNWLEIHCASNDNQPQGIKRFEELQEVIAEAIQGSREIQKNAQQHEYRLSTALQNAFSQTQEELKQFITFFHHIQQIRNELQLKIILFAGKEPPTPPTPPSSPSSSISSSTSSCRFFSSSSSNEETETETETGSSKLTPRK